MHSALQHGGSSSSMPINNAMNLIPWPLSTTTTPTALIPDIHGVSGVSTNNQLNSQLHSTPFLIPPQHQLHSTTSIIPQQLPPTYSFMRSALHQEQPDMHGFYNQVHAQVASNSSLAKQRVSKEKTELLGAANVVIDQPPVISSSKDGWKAACLTLCKDAYVRNNKRGGLKNLRCFPHCLSEGHNPLGFCGSSIYARVWLPSTVLTSQCVFLFLLLFLLLFLFFFFILILVSFFSFITSALCALLLC